MVFVTLRGQFKTEKKTVSYDILYKNINYRVHYVKKRLKIYNKYYIF